MTAAEGAETAGSRVGLTGVTEVIIGEGGSAATGERATMLMVREGYAGFLTWVDEPH